jgi:hypothetical protein
MADDPEAKRKALAGLLKDILSGSIDLGFSLIPLIAAFGKHKMEVGWKEAGFQTWLETDPKAPEILAQALKAVRNKLPEAARNMLLMALTAE